MWLVLDSCISNIFCWYDLVLATFESHDLYWILVLATPDPKVANTRIQYKSCDPELLIQDHISKISTNQMVCYTAKKDKTIYTSKKQNMYILLFWNKKWKIKLCFFPLFLPKSQENERARRIRNRQFILSGLREFSFCIKLHSCQS